MLKRLIETYPFEMILIRDLWFTSVIDFTILGHTLCFNTFLTPSFLFSYQRKSLVSENWKTTLRVSLLRPVYKFMFYPLFRSVIVIIAELNVNTSTQSSNRSNISDENGIKFEKQRTK